MRTNLFYCEHYIALKIYVYLKTLPFGYRLKKRKEFLKLIELDIQKYFANKKDTKNRPAK